MQKLTVISGLKQEGKTKELFDYYKNHFLGTTTYADGSSNLTRELIKPVFITATNENPIKDYLFITETASWMEGFDLESHKFYNKVKEKGELFNIMVSNTIDNDCIFYLDDMDDVVTINELIEFMDSFPSGVTNNSCDIIVTKLRNI